MSSKVQCLNDFSYAEFLAYYTLESKSNNTCDYQPDELDDNLIENNHEECSYQKQIKLMNLGEKMQCRKVRRILRYNAPNEVPCPEQFAHHVLVFLVFFFVDSGMRENCYQVFPQCIKINCKSKESMMLSTLTKLNLYQMVMYLIDFICDSRRP